MSAVSVSPSGQWLLSSSIDGTVKLWEVSSGRCERTWSFASEVRCIRWNPNIKLPFAALIMGNRMLFLLPLPPEGETAAKARAVLNVSLPIMRNAEMGDLRSGAGVDREAEGEGTGGEDGSDGTTLERSKNISWERTSKELQEAGLPWEVSHAKSASMVTWHFKGDYCASVAPEGASRAVLLHQVSQRSSGTPFAKSKGRVESVAFHPSKPYFFLATQRSVRMYDLARQASTLMAPCTL